MSKDKFLIFCVPPDIHNLVKEVSEARTESISNFLRRAVLQELARLSYLPAKQKKALGVPVTPEAIA